MPGQRLTDDEKDAIRRAWQSGLSLIETAATVGRSPASVGRLISRYGWHRRNQRRALRTRVVADWVQGKGRRWLMRRYGLSRSTVHRYVEGVEGGPAKIRRLRDPLLLQGAADGVTHRALADEARMKRPAVTKAINRQLRLLHGTAKIPNRGGSSEGGSLGSTHNRLGGSHARSD